MGKSLIILFGILITTFSCADEKELNVIMLKLDRTLFQEFNNCTNDESLQKFESYFSDDVEFYHDSGGVTWNRDSMISNTKKNACGNYQRKLLKHTFRAYPIKDFGAISQGVHLFCDTKTLKCEGAADFIMVWRNTGDKWKITRVLSFGHRSANDLMINKSMPSTADVSAD